MRQQRVKTAADYLAMAPATAAEIALTDKELESEDILS